MSVSLFVNVVALGVCAVVYVWRASSLGLRRAPALEAAALGVLGALLGARLAAGLISGLSSVFHPLPAAAGAMSWGAYAGGFLAASARLSFADRADTVRHFDAAAPAVLLGVAVARIGCFLNGDDFGVVCHDPWCVTFPAGSVAWEVHRTLGWIGAAARASLPVHPLQLYFSAAALGACVLTVAAERYRPTRSGGTALLAMLLYSLSRIPLELLREPASLTPGSRVSGLQLAIALLVVTVLLGLVSQRFRRLRSP